MPLISSNTLQVFAYRYRKGRSELLLLRRAESDRLAGTWHPVSGLLQDAESSDQAAVRELREQTSLPALELYALPSVRTAYHPREDEIHLYPVFVARVPEEGVVLVTEEHDDYLWAGVDTAIRKLCWPSDKEAARQLADCILPDNPVKPLLRIPR